MKENIRRALPFAISGLMVVTLMIIRFTVLKPNDEFSADEFFPQLFTNLFLIITTSIVWLNSGTERAKAQENSPYKDNSKLYAAHIKHITDAGRLGELRAFCRQKTDEMLDNKITVILANVGIDRNTYNAELKGLTVKQLKAAGYKLRQRRAVMRIIDGRVRVKPIKYMELLSDSKTVNEYGVNYDEQADKAIRITLRALRSAVIALALALLAPEPAQNITDIGVWALFLMQVCTIVVAAFSSEREGYARIADTKNKVILRRIAFLHEFDEWAAVPRLSPGK